MVGGEEERSRFRDESINEDYDVQLRLTKRRPERRGTISGCMFLHRARWTWCGSIIS
jgi:hypothetical protein